MPENSLFSSTTRLFPHAQIQAHKVIQSISRIPTAVKLPNFCSSCSDSTCFLYFALFVFIKNSSLFEQVSISYHIIFSGMPKNFFSGCFQVFNCVAFTFWRKRHGVSITCVHAKIESSFPTASFYI